MTINVFFIIIIHLWFKNHYHIVVSEQMQKFVHQQELMESDSPFNFTNLYGNHNKYFIYRVFVIIRILLVIDLGLLRIKSHCSYDTASINSADYSVFQIEIQNPDLVRDY